MPGQKVLTCIRLVSNENCRPDDSRAGKGTYLDPIGPVS
jgi:hypothetical protein